MQESVTKYTNMRRISMRDLEESIGRNIITEGIKLAWKLVVEGGFVSAGVNEVKIT